MLNISFISSGTTSSQTPIMAVMSYEIVKKWVKESNKPIPDFPLACVFDFSNMYSTLQFFASDKILMRMGELTSLVEEMTSSPTLDWSKCSFPSKFVHKETKDPLFFMIPVFPRGVTSSLSKSESLELTKNIWDISQSIKKAGTQYIFFDLPLIEVREKRFYEISALLNSNLIFGVIDTDKPDIDKIIAEIQTLESFLRDYNILAESGLSLSGLIFNKISEKVLSEKWLDQIMENFPYPIVGMIREDHEFTKVVSRYEIPTVESMIEEMKCANDLQAAAEMTLQVSNDSSLSRGIPSIKYQSLEEKIFKM